VPGSKPAAYGKRRSGFRKEETMFKHILLPTDGSVLSEGVIHKGIAFAKSIGARVTGFHAMPEFHVLTYHTEMLEDTKEEFARDSKAHAQKYLGVIEAAAKEAGVACATVLVTSDEPYEAIIKAAQNQGCDLIMMASHGRRGVRAVLLGSETQKVLAHSQLPVLVCR
jgi:nucleotide-binding universal stress UspA family protein